MARRKKYKHVIIVDETKKPMVWHDRSKQLVYCTDETWQDEHTPLTFYTILKAHRLIAKTIANRKQWKMSPGKYFTMPFELDYRQTLDLRKLKNKQHNSII